jgi:hypothetical protein
MQAMLAILLLLAVTILTFFPKDPRAGFGSALPSYAAQDGRGALEVTHGSSASFSRYAEPKRAGEEE